MSADSLISLGSCRKKFINTKTRNTCTAFGSINASRLSISPTCLMVMYHGMSPPLKIIVKKKKHAY